MGVEKVVSFTDWSSDHPSDRIPGDRLDAQLDNHANAIKALEARLDALVRADGKLHAEVIPIFPVRQNVAPRSVPLNTEPPNAATLTDAASENWADVSMNWAEHMPDTIPANILATNAITGDHWSARWWANFAAQAVGGAVALPGTVVTLVQMRNALVDLGGGVIYSVQNGISSDIADPVNIEWTGGGPVELDDPLSQHIQATLGYSDAQMQALFEAASSTISTASTVTLVQMRKALVNTGGNAIYTVSNSIPADFADPVNILWNASSIVTPGDPLAIAIQTALGYSAAQMNTLFALARTL